MKKSILALYLATLVALTACTAASGPTYNATAVDLADGSRAFRVECGGLLETHRSCDAVAASVCKGQAVWPLERRQALSTPDAFLDNPRVLIFQCRPMADETVATTITTTSPGVPVPPPIAPVILSADALFAFDRSDVASLTAGGRDQLDQLVAKILVAGMKVRHIEITGYTDRIGTAEYNAALSQRRAETIKEYLANHGVTADIAARGVGEAQPGTACGQDEAADRKALIACLAPDRRVEIRFPSEVAQ